MREMKDSGVEWIGEIPKDWEIARIKRLFSEANERCESGDDYTLLSVSEYYGVSPRAEKIEEDDLLTHANTLDNYKICRTGDIVVNIMLAWKSALGVCSQVGIVSPAYCVYRPICEMNVKYFHFLFRTKQYADVFKQYSTGVIDSRLRLYTDKFFSLYCQVPTFEEQTRIADYLDAKCAQIDRAIARQQEVIEKLKEYKLSVITEAVTKGLNPDVPMKDSGIEWIGEIPEGWKLSHIGNVAEIGSGGTPDRNKPEYWQDGTIPWMASGEINNEYVYETKELITELGLHNSNAKVLPTNTVMLGLIGQGKTKGLCAILKIESACNQNLAYMIPNTKYLFYEFLFYCLKAMYQYIRCLVGDSQAGIYQDFLSKLHVPLPNFKDQTEICHFLDSKCEMIDSILDRKQDLIDKLTEYKKSLIYEVVTGKREV